MLFNRRFHAAENAPLLDPGGNRNFPETAINSLWVSTISAPAMIKCAAGEELPSMPDYRLYFLDDVKSVMHADDFDAVSDGDAVRIARSMKKPMSCELWNLDRLVARIPAYRQS